MVPELPSEQFSEDSEALSAALTQFDQSKHVVLEFATRFYETPRPKQYWLMKYATDKMIESFSDCAHSILLLDNLDEEQKRIIIVTLMDKEDEERVNAFNKLTTSEVFRRGSVESLLPKAREDDEENDDVDDEEVDEDDFAMDEWLDDVIGRHNAYVESDINQLKSHTIKSKFGPKIAKLISDTEISVKKLIEQAPKIKTPAIEVGKMAGAASLGIYISKILDRK